MKKKRFLEAGQSENFWEEALGEMGLGDDGDEMGLGVDDDVEMGLGVDDDDDEMGLGDDDDEDDDGSGQTWKVVNDLPSAAHSHTINQSSPVSRISECSAAQLLNCSAAQLLNCSCSHLLVLLLDCKTSYNHHPQCS